MNGHIKIERKILEWEWYKNINTKVVFLHMLLKANWKDTKIEGKTIPRGSFISSIKNISFETALTENEVRCAIKHLKSTGEITSKSTNKYTVFTIKNYASYQSNNEQMDKRNTSKSQTINKLLTTNEERKEKEEISRSDYSEIVSLYNSICKSYPKVMKLSERRKKIIAARINQGFSIDDFERLFNFAESSSFLKGSNDRNWTADFDWLIKDDNMTKTLEGKYNKGEIPLVTKINEHTEKPNKNRFDCIPIEERRLLMERKIIDYSAESMDLGDAEEADLKILEKYHLIRR